MTREEVAVVNQIIADVQDSLILANAADLLANSSNLEKEYKYLQKSARYYGDKWVNELEQLTNLSLDELIAISREKGKE